MLKWDWNTLKFKKSETLTKSCDEYLTRINNLIVSKFELYFEMHEFIKQRKKNLVNEKFFCLVKKKLRSLQSEEEKRKTTYLVIGIEKVFYENRIRLGNYLTDIEKVMTVFLKFGKYYLIIR